MVVFAFGIEMTDELFVFAPERSIVPSSTVIPPTVRVLLAGMVTVDEPVASPPAEKTAVLVAVGSTLSVPAAPFRSLVQNWFVPSHVPLASPDTAPDPAAALPSMSQ